MFKKTMATILKIFFSFLFLVLKKIFIHENRIPNKTMDNIANKLHSLFLYTSFSVIYIGWFNIKINTFSLNSIMYILLFLQIVIITRYYNHKMLVVKQKQVDIVKKINKISLLIFIFTWIFLSFGTAFLFVIMLLLNNGIYQFIINQLKKQKEQDEFKKQFGDGDYSKDDIVKTHIQNLFEANLAIEDITKSDIKKQYRDMAKKYHPDVYKGNEEDKFRSINSSYKFLIDLKR